MKECFFEKVGLGGCALVGAQAEALPWIADMRRELRESKPLKLAHAREHVTCSAIPRTRWHACERRVTNVRT